MATDEFPRVEFVRNSPYNEQMARGHEKRKGHPHAGHYVVIATYTETNTPVLSLVSTCCEG